MGNKIKPWHSRKPKNHDKKQKKNSPRDGYDRHQDDMRMLPVSIEEDDFFDDREQQSW